MPAILEGSSSAHNSFFICHDEFKREVDLNDLDGVVFTADLAVIFL